MQIFVKILSGKTRTLHIRPQDHIHNIKERLTDNEGFSYLNLPLKLGGSILCDSEMISESLIRDGAFLEIGGRLLGGGGISVNVRPRIQKETWSLYWKESMNTSTDCLEDFTLNIDDSNSIQALQREIATKLGWKPVEELLRLEGFEEKWERLLHKGRELQESKTLADCGIGSNATVVAVRMELIAEGWAVHVDDDDISTSDESDL